MKFKALLFSLSFIAIALFSAENITVSTKGLKIEYSPVYVNNRLTDCAIEKNVLIKYLYINVPEGAVRVHVGDAEWKRNEGESDRKIVSKLYDLQYEYAGRQRILRIALYPARKQGSDTYTLKRVFIEVDFEKALSKSGKDNPLFASSLNREFVSKGFMSERSDRIPFMSYLDLKVKDSGIYRVDYKTIKDAGIDPQNLSVGNFGLYTQKNVMLPIDTAEFLSYLNPPKTPYLFVGDDDDDFEDGEYILFYGESPNGDSINFYMNYDIYNNPFSDYRHYMLVFNDKNPIKANNLVFSFEKDEHRIFNEKVMHYDSINPLLSGYGWVWKKFSLVKDSGDFEYEFDFETPDFAGESCTISLSFFFPNGGDTSTVEVKMNDSFLGTIEYGTEMRYTPAVFSFSSNNLAANNKVILTAKNIDNLTKSFYLSEFRVKYEADTDNPDDIVIKNASFRYLNLNPTSDIYCFVKNGGNYYLGGIAAGENISLDILSGEFAFLTNEIKKPENARWVDNSKIYADIEGCDILIIAGDNFREAVIPYTQYRKSQGYIVKTFEIGRIADAFGFGVSSPSAVKAFLEYGFREWKNFPEYLILLGSGSYDFKNRQNIHENRNVVPVYETGYGIFEEALLSASTTWCVDRWYALLTGEDQYIDIIPGRITAMNREEAFDALLKVIDYETKTPTFMKNKMMVISDDEYGGRISETFNETGFFVDAEDLSGLLESRFPVRKLYLMDYIGSLQGDEEHWPYNPGYKRDVRFVIRDYLNEGIAYGFFYGHGSYYTLTHEHILLYPDDIELLDNTNRYPIFLFGTCQVGQFDNDFGAIGAEFQKLPKSGFSAVIASTRAIFEYESVSILYNSFASNLIAGGFNTIGEYYLSMINDGRYFSTSHVLFGDPSMRVKKHLFDVSVLTEDTLMLGALNDIGYDAEFDFIGPMSVDLYQPFYTDSHDYLHILPYAYLYYVKSDGVMSRTETKIDSNTLSVYLTDDFEERNFENRILITSVCEDDSFVHSGIDVLHAKYSPDSSASSGEISFFSNEKPLEDSITLPLEYPIEVNFTSNIGVYMGSIQRYLPSLTAKGNASVSSENKIFVKTDSSSSNYYSVSSAQDVDTVTAVIYDSNLKEFRKSIIIRHNFKSKSEKRFNLYPNPFSDAFTISFTSSAGGTMKWKLIDSRGFIASAGEEIVQGGYNSIKIAPNDRMLERDLETGIYMFTADFIYYGKSEIVREKRKVVKL
ncbi:MAG: C25 family cysteine peptidase [bacterium]